jgi:predicted permease
MLRSLAALWSVDPGFRSANVLTFGLGLPPSMLHASPDAIRAAIREIDNKIASAPGVEAASQTWGAFPMYGDDESLFWLEGQPKPTSIHERNWALKYVVEPDYLKVMGIPLERGRFFTPQDDEHSPLVVIVDDVFARKYFGNENPVGRRLYTDDHDKSVEIVGVVGHVKQWGLDADDNRVLRAQLYLPFMQMPDVAMALVPAGTSVVVRSNGTVPGLFDSIRHGVQEINSQHVVYSAETMDEIISSSLAARRFSMILFIAFASLALLLSSVGIYGVISYLVGQRTHEIGIRIALGAQRRDVLRLVLGEGTKMTLLGVVIGLAAALALTRFMANMLYGVSATDPLIFAGVAVVLTLVALAACYIPARRATRVDPIIALRYE